MIAPHWVHVDYGHHETAEKADLFRLDASTTAAPPLIVTLTGLHADPTKPKSKRAKLGKATLPNVKAKAAAVERIKTEFRRAVDAFAQSLPVCLMSNYNQV